MPIKFLSKIEKWKDFSNLSSHPIELDGETWKSAEHYYQFKKFEISNPAYAQKIKNAPTPKEAKKLSLENHIYDPNWNTKKVGILQRAVQKKFESYHDLQTLLLSTGEQELIEANPEDSFWGEGPDGRGRNMMGKILMQVRQYLREHP